MRPSHRATRIFYVDDSGAETTGIASYSWVSVLLDDWRAALSEVLAWREHLNTTYGIPKHYELHATKFANGRGNPSLDDAWNRSKANRSVVLDESFNRFAEWGWMTAGTIYSQGNDRREGFKKRRHRVYSKLVHQLDGDLHKANEWGMLVMDGDGSDTSYISAHRELDIATRSLLEDPGFQHSSRTQWVQVADLVAYAAYQHIAEIPEKQFAWQWYPTLVSGSGGILVV